MVPMEYFDRYFFLKKRKIIFVCFEIEFKSAKFL